MVQAAKAGLLFIIAEQFKMKNNKVKKLPGIMKTIKNFNIVNIHRYIISIIRINL
jgi:hypothetical protein